MISSKYLKSVLTISSRNVRFLHTFHGKNIIGSSKPSSSSKETIFAVDPKTNQKFGNPFQVADSALVDRALNEAEKDFHELKQKSGRDISKFLKTIGSEISNDSKQIIETAMKETAYPQQRIEGEFQRTINQINMFAKLVETGDHLEIKITNPPGKPDIRRILFPIGNVVVFGARGDTISAFAAKCPVIVKAHPAHPGTSELVAEAIQRAIQKSSFPTSIFSLLHGGNEIGMGLVKHDLTRAVGFTGSFRGGKALFDAGASRKVPIPVYAEMGSVNPVFILPDALNKKAKEIAEALVQSATLSVGQFCTNPGIYSVHCDITGVVVLVGNDANSFIEHVVKAAVHVPPGFMLTSGIRKSYIEGIQRLQKVKNVKVEAIVKSEENSNSVGTAVFSTDVNTFLREKELQEECFGPSTILVKCSSIEESIYIAKQIDGQLTGSIHGTEVDFKNKQTSLLLPFLREKVGRIIFNGFPTGVEVTPSMTHGGPFPASSDSRSTSVGTEAIKRFLRPLSFQNAPQYLLPAELQNENKERILRQVNDSYTTDPIL